MLKFASLITLATILSATASGQCKEVSSDDVNAEGGGNGIFMDKRSPEERCEKSGEFAKPKIFDSPLAPSLNLDPALALDPVVANEFAQSGGDPKILKDEFSTEVVAGGGGNDIFMDPRAPEERGINAEGGSSGIFMDKRPPEEREAEKSPF